MTILQDYGFWLARQGWLREEVEALVKSYRPEVADEICEGYVMFWTGRD